jgi:hypothetical protein
MPVMLVRLTCQPLIDRNLVDGRGRGRDARVVEQHVQPGHGGKGRRDLIGVAHIAGQDARGLAGGGLFQQGGAASQQGDIPAVRPERPGRWRARCPPLPR